MMKNLRKKTSCMFEPMRQIMLTSRLLFSILFLALCLYLSIHCNFKHDGFQEVFLIDKSLFTVTYFGFYFYISLNIFEYFMQIVCGFYKYPTIEEIFFKILLIASKLILTFALLFLSVFVFLAGLDIWYGALLNLDPQWFIMRVYYYTFFLYLFSNFVELFFNLKINDYLNGKKRIKKIEQELIDEDFDDSIKAT